MNNGNDESKECYIGVANNQTNDSGNLDNRIDKRGNSRIQWTIETIVYVDQDNGYHRTHKESEGTEGEATTESYWTM